MQSRRGFLSGVLALASCVPPAWADAGGPRYLSSARLPNGAHALIGLRADGGLAFSQPLPARGHAAAAHPNRAEAVAFARRPGTYGLVIDCMTGRVSHRLETPPARHFYGHGAFSADGATLFTTENDIATGAGRIGVWDADAGYRRIGELPSGGVGPHEIIRIAQTGELAVANGGIRTHPDTGREKLNLDEMRPNLTLMAPEGRIADVAELPATLHQNSLRHIADLPGGRVACAFQWQGDPFAAPSIVGVYTPGGGLALLPMAEGFLRGLDGYAGSIAALGAQRLVASFPRGNALQVFDLESGAARTLRQTDVCGVAGAMATDGLGGVQRIGQGGFTRLAQHAMAFDNHLVQVG
ncbi:DUF1513 domain-containing protein [uncultured Roseobacter sp.]|uniref:DUF1513 domain-containing protein n=1 Tax=uncultured Roseobacter sp. TaxID=114847 RepID=UPI00260BC5B9|nr:DUF1513 domain-containing protein [uncultured Roseobacter sp.]